QRRRSGLRRAHMQKVNGLPIELGRELWELVQQGFVAAPTVSKEVPRTFYKHKVAIVRETTSSACACLYGLSYRQLDRRWPTADGSQWSSGHELELVFERPEEGRGSHVSIVQHTARSLLGSARAAACPAHHGHALAPMAAAGILRADSLIGAEV